MSEVSRRVSAAEASFAPVADFYFRSRYADRRFEPGVADFTFGNPQEMPLPGFVSALREAAVPHDKNWFAYKTSEDEPRAFLAEHVGRELGLSFEPEDFALTAGAFAAIAIAARMVLDAGDEAIISEPAWFCYEPILYAADAVPRKVRLKEPDFDLDLAAIDAAITPKTRLVIVNTPHNPTGRIYGRTVLTELADLLDRASARIGRRIFLLSDEPYRRLRFDGRGFVSPAAVYPWTMISYSYGKILLAPGQRVGYLAFSPLMPPAERKPLREATFAAQMALGWNFASALMQHAIPALEGLSIDQAALTRRRDRLMATLATAGFAPLLPEGTFYLFSRWPEGDPAIHLDRLADRDVFVMPGTILAAPNHFRISLTASDAMVEKAVPAFTEVGAMAPRGRLRAAG
ncbi:MAG TPA: aminotransferase class I/II-fold pyridoxal phosphate-dependent enzyme [Bauldia sp.]|nr:aminotransferase class I/II-fold pyridoxal phosphate-dependent enzyme [Bauldia sp.]